MRPLIMKAVSALVLVGGGASAALLAGCDTEAYCFSDCGEGASTATAMEDGGAGGNGGSMAQFPDGGSTGMFMDGAGGAGGAGPCQETNGGIEICDGVDNDCNDQVDDIADLDLEDPRTCGICSNNCYNELLNVDPTTITCTPSDNPGTDPGTCEGDCAQDYHDLDGDGDCELYCVVSTPNLDAVCDAKDDDCDGSLDEDVQLCSDEQNCGQCGRICAVANGTPECVHTDADPNCTSANTRCEIASCDPGWQNLDGLYSTGCEYPCTPTGPELCGDGVDNDCNGLVDAADDLSGDPQIDILCTGDDDNFADFVYGDGICGDTVNHGGMTACVNGIVVCEGPDVLNEGDEIEMCNGDDDDCDGLVDDNPSDQGASCGTSNIFPCRFGTMQCQPNGTLDCVGEVNPGTEVCNGIDDNCDGGIDRVGVNMPADSIGPCNVPIPPPPGATSPCMAGTKTCAGGVIDCVGDVGPTSPTDTCGVDANCDGSLTNQPNLMTDSLNCGTCGNNCNVNQGTNHAIRRCNSGSCAFQQCVPGWVDLNGDGTCEYNCTFVSSTEACNNRDDDCDGQIDEMVPALSPKQVCDVSPNANRPECTTSVNVQCVAGNWQCTFPANVCNGTVPGDPCGSATERCDALDNDCDGLFNENVPDFGQPCASDDANPGSQGECRRTGTKVCNGLNATMCSATPAACNTLPDMCVELCDGKDNDCDGRTDEPRSSPGTNTTFYYKPKVIALPGNIWIYQQEASRPTSTATSQGSGNGYFTSSPPGETQDQTPSCSEPSRVPWFNVTPDEGEQVCAAAGGRLCRLSDWREACHVTPAGGANDDCLYGYAPFGIATSGCHVGFTTGTKFCNLGPSYDFSAAAGDQDGLLPTQSNLLANCWSPWEGVNGNPNTVAGRLFDMTGNLREITRTTTAANSTYTLMGGAFNTAAESGATCDFTFYVVDDEFKFFDTGFRCCFTTNPSL